MFIRIWHVSSNVGSDDPTIEEYVAIRHILRFYSKRYEGEAENRYIVVVSGVTASSYVTEKTFEYLKSLRSVKNRTSAKSVSLQYPGADGHG